MSASSACVLCLTFLATAVLSCGTASCSKSKGDLAKGLPDGGPANNFEGEVDCVVRYSTKPDAQPETLSILVMNGRVRFDIPDAMSRAMSSLGGRGYVIIDSSSNRLEWVSDARQTVITIDLNRIDEAFPGLPPPTSSGAATRVTKTGKTDSIVGRSCEYWDIARDSTVGSICMSDDGPSWLPIPMTGLPPERAWQAELADGKHFPLRIIGYAGDGVTELGRLDVTRIDRRPLTGAEFEVPSSYKAIDLAAMKLALGAVGGCPVGMVLVPGTMGQRGGNVTVQSFCMDVTEVTVQAYESCVRAGQCTAAATTVDWAGISDADRASWSAFCNGARADRSNHPANCVDFAQATAYCRAQGKRLPSDQEWEWAARGGGEGRIYPWGNSPPDSQLCWSGKTRRRGTCVVGSFPEGDARGGIHDLAGNVSEWTSGEYPGSRGDRFIRGGSWWVSDASILRAAHHFEGTPPGRSMDVGFRCAR